MPEPQESCIESTDFTANGTKSGDALSNVADSKQEEPNVASAGKVEEEPVEKEEAIKEDSLPWDESKSQSNQKERSNVSGPR